MADKDIETANLKTDNLETDNLIDTKTEDDPGYRLQFANYFDEKNNEMEDCCSGKCMGETLLPCVPGFGCGTAC